MQNVERRNRRYTERHMAEPEDLPKGRGRQLPFVRDHLTRAPFARTLRPIERFGMVSLLRRPVSALAREACRVIPQTLKRWTRRALGSEDRLPDTVQAELRRLGSAPRYTRLSSDLLGSPIEIVDGASFCASYDEIFTRQLYAFRSPTGTPRIVDVGSNIGLSVLYFKARYPSSRIVAFEADPVIFKILEANVRRAGHDDVQLINRAVWREDTGVEFRVEGADAGRISRGPHDPLPDKVSVPAVRLRQYLTGHTDFLKLDIEGAETEVLLDCANLLGQVGNLFVEYHSFAGEEQRLDVLLGVLRTSGFRVYVQTQICPPQPLLERPLYLGMDLQLNVFATRD